MSAEDRQNMIGWKDLASGHSCVSSQERTPIGFRFDISGNQTRAFSVTFRNYPTGTFLLAPLPENRIFARTFKCMD